MSTDRELAVDAVDVLNDIIGDLAAATNVFREYRRQFVAGNFGESQLSAIQKMCFSHLVLALNKLLEFRKHYNGLVASELRQTAKQLYKSIESRGVKEFRDKVAGHIWDDDVGRPLRQSEIQTMLETLIGAHADRFLDWVNNPEANVYPSTVLSVVESVRDRIAADHGVAPSDILQR